MPQSPLHFLKVDLHPKMETSRQTAETRMTTMTDEEASLFSLLLASASVFPMVLKAVLELGLLEIMEKSCHARGGFISPKEIAAQLRSDNPDAPIMLDRILRLLESYSIVTCKLRDLPDGKVERLYGLTEVCKFFMKNEDGVSLAPAYLLIQDKAFMESWYYLKDSILEGGTPFNKAHGIDLFEYLGTDPRLNKLYYTGMSDFSAITMTKILKGYKGFEGLNTVVVVGGGTGAVIGAIVSKYPSVKGINFDLPHVIEDAPSIQGVEHVGGDMFLSVPKGDAIFVKAVCHDWSEEHCLQLLKNCYAALPDQGKVIVAEFITPLSPDPSLMAKQVFELDCIMWAHLHGKERTEKEFEALAKGAGFKGFRVAHSVFNLYVMEFLKKA